MKTGLLRKLENLMVAVAFAEEGDHEYAIRVMSREPEVKNRESVRKDLAKQAKKRARMRL